MSPVVNSIQPRVKDKTQQAENAVIYLLGREAEGSRFKL